MTNNLLRKYISLKRPYDAYYLDSENAIMIVQSLDGYTYIHLRVKDARIQEISRWSTQLYGFHINHSEFVIPEMHLFKVQNDSGHIGAIYDYLKEQFVIPPGVWNEIMSEGSKVDYLKKYGGFVARLNLTSTPKDDNTASFQSAVTEEKETICFYIDQDFYAILDLDGSIRCNTLFQGDSLSQIETVIDLGQYASLEDFKEKRQKMYDEEGKRRKEYFAEQLKIAGATSPYKDEEVLKVLNFKPNKDPKQEV